MDKRFMLEFTQTVQGLAASVIAALILAGMIEFWHLVLGAFVIGGMMTFNMPARQSLVPDLVPQRLLTNAISLQMGGMSLTRIIAPAMAGLLIAPLGVGWVVLMSGTVFFMATLADSHLPRRKAPISKGTGRFLAEVGEVFPYIWRDHTLRLLLLAGILIPICSFPVQQTLPVFSEDVFHTGASGLGIMAGVMGVGGVSGAILSANMARKPRSAWLMLLGGVVTGASFIAFAYSPFFGLALVFLCLAAVGQMLFMTTNSAAIQADLPLHIRGRVLSVMTMSIGLTPLGVMPVAVAADEIGAPAAVAILASLLITLMVLVFAASPRLRALRI
jgi:MFS family permease